MAPPKQRIELDLIAQLQAAPHRFRFFQAIRLLALAQAGAAAGTQAKTHAQPHALAAPGRIRFRSPAALAFPPSEILGLGRAGPLEEMVVGFFGLTGPSGVLPSHYTELLMERQDAHRDTAAHAFLDLFTHRALVLFYAAWRKYRFHLAYEQGERGGFTEHLLSFIGLGSRPGDLPDRILAFFSGALAQRPLPASAMVNLLGAYFGVEVGLESFVGHWIAVPDQERTRLGGQACSLAGTAFLGARLWDRQTRIRLRIGPLAPEEFIDLQPGHPGGLALARFVRACLGHSLACDLTLVLAAGAAPPAALPGRVAASPRLGSNLWLTSRPMERDLDVPAFRLLD